MPSSPSLSIRAATIGLVALAIEKKSSAPAGRPWGRRRRRPPIMSRRRYDGGDDVRRSSFHRPIEHGLETIRGRAAPCREVPEKVIVDGRGPPEWRTNHFARPADQVRSMPAAATPSNDRRGDIAGLDP